MRTLILLSLTSAMALAQSGQVQQPKGQWQQPGEIQRPKGTWQTPGEIQQPKGPWQVPKGIQAIRSEDANNCQQRLIIGADALFEFNKDTLSPDARETLSVLGPMIQKAGKHPITIEGYTDAVGSDAYNQDLSERRAKTVRAWLAEQHYADVALLQIKGNGKNKPVAPNANPDGSDNPEGRQKNRRVEVVIDNCK